MASMERITTFEKCIHLQEDILKENLFIQLRMVLDRRNLKIESNQGMGFIAS